MNSRQSLTDKLYYTSERTYDARRGDIYYLDGSPLKRARKLSGSQLLLVLIFVAIAAVIGSLFINSTVLASVRAAENAEIATAENLTRPASIESVPLMSEMINLSDDEIRARFDEENYAYYDMTEASGGTLTLFKLPADVSEADGSALLVRGVDALTSEQASRLLQGAWYFSADRTSGTSMVVRYADFSTGSPDVAIQSAIKRQGFDPETITDSGIDDSGNAYSMGNVEIGGAACTWRVSSLPLSDVYDIQGLPSDAVYVGVRISK